MAAVTLRLLPALLLACIVLVGCGGGGGGRSNPRATYPRADHYPDPYYNDNHQVYDPFYNDGYSYDPLVRYPSAGTLAPRATADLLSRQVDAFAGAFGGNFAELHQRAQVGLHGLDVAAYLFASPNVALSRDPADPQRLSLSLLSGRDTVSFVTYGLFDPSTLARLYGLEVLGAGSFATYPDSGMYVGVRQFGEPRYRWYGPYRTAAEWRVDLHRDSNLARGSAAYVTLAVFNGDELRLDGLSVDIGS